MNLFVEGIQGMGKSTLVRKLEEKYPGSCVYREGDYCPVELAWCTWMTQAEYVEAIQRYPSLKSEIEKWTAREGDRYIVCYTRILTDEPGFHKYMEQFEIYNGRKTFQEFQEIVYTRYENLPLSDAGVTKTGCLTETMEAKASDGTKPMSLSGMTESKSSAGRIGAKRGQTGHRIYECVFFQNIMEELILYQQLSDEEIRRFYARLVDLVISRGFRLYYLYGTDIEGCIRHVQRERSDENGNQLWYQLMMEYFKASPYGRRHGAGSFDDLISYFRHRQQLELSILRQLPQDHVVLLPAKAYLEEDI